MSPIQCFMIANLMFAASQYAFISLDQMGALDITKYSSWFVFIVGVIVWLVTFVGSVAWSVRNHIKSGEGK